MYTVDYFINKFEAIPEEKWCIEKWADDDKRCAFGHCGVNTDNFLSYPSEAKGLADLFPLSCVVFDINDGDDKRYQQPTPKQRILAALYDIKKAQSPTYPDLTKELAVLPVDRVETDIKVLTPTS